MNLQDLLKKTVEEDASDLHITVGSPPRIRKGGKLIPISDIKLSSDETKSLIVSEIKVDGFCKVCCYWLGMASWAWQVG